MASTNSHKIKSQSSLGLMMSHSSAFRKTREESASIEPKPLEANPEKKERALSTPWSNPPDHDNNVRLNYRYNVLYNYFPSMQNTDIQSTFVLNNHKKKVAIKPNLNAVKPLQIPEGINSPAFDSRPVTSRALSSRGVNFILTQQAGTASTRTLSSQGLRCSTQSQLMTTSSPLSTARGPFFTGNELNTEINVKVTKKVVINTDRVSN